MVDNSKRIGFKLLIINYPLKTTHPAFQPFNPTIIAIIKNLNSIAASVAAMLSLFQGSSYFENH